MRPMTNELRKKIQMFIKNRLDISELIFDIDIKGENLNRAIIKKFDRINQDISGCSFVDAIIGEKEKETHLSGTKMIGCNFKQATFLGILYFRRVDARGSNFQGSYMPFIEYQRGDFRNCNLCDASITFGSRAGHGARITKKMLDMWGLIIE